MEYNNKYLKSSGSTKPKTDPGGDKGNGDENGNGDGTTPPPSAENQLNNLFADLTGGGSTNPLAVPLALPKANTAARGTEPISKPLALNFAEDVLKKNTQKKTTTIPAGKNTLSVKN